VACLAGKAYSMSKCRDLETQIRSLDEIKEIMNAMKNLSLMEIHRLARLLDTQHRVVATVESAAAYFLSFHPQQLARTAKPREVYVIVGSERGFCGDFNEALLHGLERHGGVPSGAGLVAVGGKLANKMAGDQRATAFVNGASVVEEVDSVLTNLTETLTKLASEQTVCGPLTVLHKVQDSEGVQFSVLRPFKQPESKLVSAYPPVLNVKPEVFLRELADQYLMAALQEVLYRSLAAENQRRLQHMDSAVNRLERVSAKLARRHNVLRQEEITEEIEVIMLGAEWLK
jgi:F-type H+-transporting ATPase subunit gamma